MLVFLFIGTWSVTAQDFIFLRNGEMLEGKVAEVSSTEIRYHRQENLQGPMIVIPTANVLSIRYENGNYEVINAGTVNNTDITITQERTPEASQTDLTQNTVVASDKLTVGININLGGFFYQGVSFGVEFNKSKLNAELNVFIPGFSLIRIDRDQYGGSYGQESFVILCAINYFYRTQNGGAYTGGGIVYEKRGSSTYFYFGFNGGYKFELPSGLYFRTGGFIGVGLIFWDGRIGDTSTRIKPNLAIGYNF